MKNLMEDGERQENQLLSYSTLPCGKTTLKFEVGSRRFLAAKNSYLFLISCC